MDNLASKPQTQKNAVRFFAVLIFFLSFFLFSPVVFAGLGDTVGGNLNKFIENSGEKTSLNNFNAQTALNTSLGTIVKIFLGFTSAIFFIIVIYAGFSWMTSQGNEETIKKSQKMIVESVLGLAIIFFAYLIAYAISALLGSGTGFQEKQSEESDQIQIICPGEEMKDKDGRCVGPETGTNDPGEDSETDTTA